MIFNLKSTYYKHRKCKNNILKQKRVPFLKNIKKLRFIKLNDIKIGTTYTIISSVNKKHCDKDNHNHC